MKILVPVDGSEQSANAATWAARRAVESGGSITLIHVYEMPATEAMGLAHQSPEAVEKARRQDAKPSFDKATAAIGDISAIADTIVAIGEPAEEILANAKMNAFDHIVMGSRGLSPLGELLLGSVSERVIQEAPCAVTIIR